MRVEHVPSASSQRSLPDVRVNVVVKSFKCMVGIRMALIFGHLCCLPIENIVRKRLPPLAVCQDFVKTAPDVAVHMT